MISWIIAFALALGAAAEQQPLLRDAEPAAALHGRILHITDFHPDQFYTPYAPVQDTCHNHTKEGSARKNGPLAGYWAPPPQTSCDSPTWLAEQVVKDISSGRYGPFDFILWTGDSVRHDRDNVFPRDTHEILAYNSWTMARIRDAFPNVPLVMSLGNNDVFPHNIYAPGPTRLSRELLRVYNDIIPEDQMHIAEMGTFYWRQVVPGLAVISLNTLYFFESNAAVDGCRLDDPDDAGSEQLDWLASQLRVMRSHNMKAWIIGHVAAIRKDWYDECLGRYSRLVLEFRDVIVGQTYGHMNTDHFFFIEQDDSLIQSDTALREGAASAGLDEDEDGPSAVLDDEYRLETRYAPPSQPADDSRVDVKVGSSYFDDLRGNYAGIPRVPADTAEARKRKPSAPTRDEILRQYAVGWVSPSVVPLYYPTFRIITYETGDIAPPAVQDSGIHIDKKKRKKKKKGKKGQKKHPKLPDIPYSPPGPAYERQKFTPLAISQYFLNTTALGDDARLDEVSAHGLPWELFYDTRQAPSFLPDLTVPSIMHYARQLAAQDPVVLPSKMYNVSKATRSWLQREGLKFDDAFGSGRRDSELASPVSQWGVWFRELADSMVDVMKKKKSGKSKKGWKSQCDQLWNEYKYKAFVGCDR